MLMFGAAKIGGCSEKIFDPLCLQYIIVCIYNTCSYVYAVVNNSRKFIHHCMISCAFIVGLNHYTTLLLLMHITDMHCYSTAAHLCNDR